MMEETEPRQRKRKRLWLALAALVALLAFLIVPPFLSVSRYKGRITQLISASLGRPVRLSSVEVRLLPRPGFLLTNLIVEEDPAYGAEPVLQANTVTASIRLLSLWRGRLEIDTISVDEASLNLVRTSAGRWNIDSLLHAATAQVQSAAGNTGPGKPVKLPYLKATNSRINIKNGAEKLPFSLLNAEVSLWLQSPGEWRVRLRGQPVRTDLSLLQADTGTVRLEANLRQAAQLRQMPVHLDLEWREAQLGQLTRLLLGSDAGWRGDLTGELQLDGTAEAAQIKTRLRATGVHRVEFAPAAPMDFDANCTLVAHFFTRAIDNLLCDSPLGSGQIRFT
ncbi:MAG: AsmA family protein, partial [Terracidiphilus sp.]